MLKLFNILKKEKKSSADIAKDRLQILIASNKKHSKLPQLKVLEDEILQVLRKYIEIDEKDMDINLQEDDETGMEVLELNVKLPDGDELNISS